MAPFKSIAVVGTGAIGKTIVGTLLSKPDVTTFLLRRPESKSDFSPPSLTIESVDLTDVNALTAIFQKYKTQVVISAVGVSAIDDQITIAKALHAAGGKLFLPSEFSGPNIGAKSVPGLSRQEYNYGTYGVKYEVSEKIKEFIPITRIFTNGFSEYIPWSANLDDKGIFHIAGKGDTPISFTAIKDIGYYTATVVTTVEPEKLENQDLHISSDKKTFNEIASLFGDKVKVVHIEKFPDDAPNAGFLNGIHQMCEAGTHSGDEAGAANILLPGYKWTPIRESLGL